MVFTLIDILGGANNFVELLQVQALYTLESHTYILAIFVLQLYEKPQHLFICQVIPKIFGSYREGIIVVQKLCFFFFYAK